MLGLASPLGRHKKMGNSFFVRSFREDVSESMRLIDEGLILVVGAFSSRFCVYTVSPNRAFLALHSL